jgi:hypothetical protein
MPIISGNQAIFDQQKQTWPRYENVAERNGVDDKHPEQFGMRQHSIVQRLLKAVRKKAAEKFIAQKPPCAATIATPLPGPVDGSGYKGPDPPTAPPVEPASTAMRLIRSVDLGSSAPTVLSG